MRAIVHVPTEQFGFVSAEFESSGKGITEPEYIKAVYDGITHAFAPKPINSLETKPWNKFLERVLEGEPNHIEEFEKCSPEQKKVINEVKKALSRIEGREPRELRDRFNETNE